MLCTLSRPNEATSNSAVTIEPKRLAEMESRSEGGKKYAGKENNPLEKKTNSSVSRAGKDGAQGTPISLAFASSSSSSSSSSFMLALLVTLLSLWF